MRYQPLPSCSCELSLDKSTWLEESELGEFVSLKIYDNAGHGFENPNNTEAYRPEAAADAWNRTLVFLRAAVK